MLRTVRRLGVTSSPVVPSPRVAPRTSTPSTYRRLMASPSTLGSTTNGPGSRPARSRARWYQACNSSNEKALARLSMGTRCRTGAKRSDGVAPTRWVGDSGVTSSGWAASSARSACISRSYSASAILGLSST
jgi:hypothetical protein